MRHHALSASWVGGMIDHLFHNTAIDDEPPKPVNLMAVPPRSVPPPEPPASPVVEHRVNQQSRRKDDSVGALMVSVRSMIKRHQAQLIRHKEAQLLEKIQSRHATILVRVGLWWTHNTGTVPVIELQRIEVAEEYQAQRVLTGILNQLEETADVTKRVLRIEKATEPVIRGAVLHRKYIQCDHDPESYFRLPQAIVRRPMPTADGPD